MSVSAPPKTVEIELRSLLRLLVKANRFDPADWPAGYERGAELLREIRRIEQDCVRQHGRWHPDLLPEGGEDHYEDLIFELDDLIEPFDPSEPAIPFSEILAEFSTDLPGSNDNHKQ